MITNLFEAAHERAVLVNYTTYPFLHRPGGHPNHYESHLIARAFHDRGYRVDVADFADDTPIDLTPYDVLFGFGQAFERSFTAAHRPGVKRIYYATGAHVSHQNPAEIARVRAVNRRHGTRLLPQRVVPWCWSLSTSLSDAMIVLGNDWVASTYRPFTDAPVHSLATTALFHPDGARIERDYARRPLGLLWFGSAGFVHKGLDVCLEYAAADPGIRLHVCAAKEPAFMDAFAAYFRLPNVAYHRFVDVCSPTGGGQGPRHVAGGTRRPRPCPARALPRRSLAAGVCGRLRPADRRVPRVTGRPVSCRLRHSARGAGPAGGGLRG